MTTTSTQNTTTTTVISLKMMTVLPSLLLIIVSSLTSTLTSSFFCDGFSFSSHSPTEPRNVHKQARKEARKRIFIPTTLQASSSSWLSSDKNGSGNSNNGGSPSDPLGGRQQFPLDWRDDSRINVLNLLTQRSVQSFLYLCESVRDPHSGKWIQDFLDCPNQLEYHGTGANYVSEMPPPPSSSTSTTSTTSSTENKPRYVGDGTWDGPLLAMVEQPKDVVIVSAKRRGAGHGGWSKDNVSLIDEKSRGGLRYLCYNKNFAGRTIYN